MASFTAIEVFGESDEIARSLGSLDDRRISSPALRIERLGSVRPPTQKD